MIFEIEQIKRDKESQKDTWLDPKYWPCMSVYGKTYTQDCSLKRKVCVILRFAVIVKNE